MDHIITFVMQHWVLWLALGLVLLLLAIVELRNKLLGFPQLTPQEAVMQINHHHAIVLDIRDATSFAKGHIVDAINIPFADIKNHFNKIEPYKAKPVIITCSIGQNSSQAATLLRQHEFSSIYCLRGGINTWQQANFPLVKTP